MVAEVAVARQSLLRPQVQQPWAQQPRAQWLRLLSVLQAEWQPRLPLAELQHLLDLAPLRDSLLAVP